MAGKPDKIVRCAIYTRKSTEHGLELEFNSLDAQREACEAYIKSQASEGWRVLPEHYDDPAYSGGNLDRPALQKLLKDIEAGHIDAVVVYKIDRLTRSLADFAKLVEIFDARGISFVAVTQQFTTSSSMGRLTLNVLLSFAQFERELASERVKDKVAASRKKGKWTGGSVPLGYDSKDKKLVVNPAEAKTVKLIFSRYLALKSFQKLIDELNAKGIVTKRRSIAGRTAGGVPFTYGPLAYLLKNRTYLGETGHGGKWFPGEHEPIVDRKTFEAVQALLKTNSEGRTGRRQRTGALLTGLIYDDRGNRMSPSFSVKNGVRYPFYVSSALLRGGRQKAGSLPRVSATEIETAVLIGLRKHLGNGHGADCGPRELVERFVDRITVHKNKIAISLKSECGAPPPTIELPWAEAERRNLAKIENDHSSKPNPAPDPQLVQSIVRAHMWLALLRDGQYESVEDLAADVDMHPKVIRSRIRLAFFAPMLTKAFLTSLAPQNATLVEIVDCTRLRWDEQLKRFPAAAIA